MRTTATWLTAALAAAAGFAAGRAAAQTPAAPAAAAPTEAVAPVACYLKVARQQTRVTLVGRTDTTVTFVVGGSAVGQKREIRVEEVDACFFELEYNYGAINRALAKRDWPGATRALYPTLAATLPFLHIPNNNAIESALELGNYMKSAADEALRAAATDEQKDKAKDQYKAAFAVFMRLGKANWSSLGMVGKIKSYQILMTLDKPKTARQLFEKLSEPSPGDRSYGLFWLLKAQLDVETGDFRSAMQAAIKSLCFENKDVDSFPDALLVSAHCYEEFQEWYRARDVYYEVARIFPDTDWQDRAVRRLHFIMDKGYTKDPEKSPIENVFFAVNEDMNKLVKELFEALASGKKSVYKEYEEKAESDKSKDVEDKAPINLDEPDK